MALSKSQWRVIKIVLLVLGLLLIIGIPIYFNLGTSLHSATL